MFVLPKKRMAVAETLQSIFSCWKSLILVLLPLSFLGVLLTSIPTLGLKFSLIVPFHVGFYIATALSYAIYLIPSGAIIYFISNALHGTPITSVKALQVSLSRFPKMLLTGIILLLIMYILVRFGFLFAHINRGLGLGAAFLFVLVVSPYLMPASPLVVIDNKWPHEAIVGGIRLVNGNWLSVFITLLIISFVTLLLNYIASHLGSIVVFIVSMFTLPLTLSMTVMITENLKLKK